MNLEWIIPVVASSLPAATPLVYASLGELVSERAGVLNLGVEGMMLAGAIGGFATATATGSLTLGFAGGMLAGFALAMVFAVLALTLQTNQVATGLALTLFGVGLSAFVGRGYVGQTIDGLKAVPLPGLAELPGIGPMLFRLDLLTYLTLPCAFVLQRFFARSRLGLVVRAAGESPSTAHAIGFPVVAIRYGAVGFGGMMAGLGGAYLSLCLTPLWIEGMTAGRGWIALALVVFATWKPLRVVGGAWLFGVVTVLQFHAQALGVAIPSEFLSMLPYVATIVVLVIICRNPAVIRVNQPASLGRSFHPEG